MSHARSAAPSVLLFLAVLFITGAAAPAQTSDTATGPPRHPTRERSYDVHHYRLNITLDLEAKRCAGDVSVTFSPLRPRLDTLRLDAAGLDVKQVSLAGKKSSTIPMTFRTDDSTLIVALNKPYGLRDSLTVTVSYETVNPKKGMYFITPDSGYPLKQRQVWTQGEMEDNHYWFPCYDFPNDFATSELIATVDEPYTVIGNGALVDVRRDKKNATATWHWLERKPHVSYLISLVAGTYVEVRDAWKDVPVSSFVYPHQRDIAKYSFAKTPGMIEFFSTLTGIPYPYEKYAQTVVQDFIFGGEENVTAVTLNDGTMHDARAHLDVSSDGLVSHELAHQWFGNMVTCRSWAHAWLNEGFATYLETLYQEHDKGRDEAEREMVDRQLALTITDIHSQRRPTVTDRYYAPIDVFDSRIYGKGACILAMMRHELGDDLFWKAVRAYLRKHQWGNAETNDLKIVIEDETGRNLDWFFEQWVYKAGFPELSVEWRWDSTARAAVVDVAQTQSVDSLTGLFRLKADIEVWSGGAPVTHTVTIDRKRQLFRLPAATRPDLVLFDPGSVILKRLTQFKPLDEWLYQLRHAAHAVDREMAISRLRQDIDTPRVAAVLREISLSDPFWRTRQAAVRTVSSSVLQRRTDDFLTASRDTDARVRAAALSALSDYPGNVAVQRRLTDAFNNDSSYSVAAAALRSLVWVDSANAYTWCRKGLERDSHKDVIRNAALHAIADVGGDSALQQVMAFTRYGVERELRVSALWLLGRTWKERPEVIDRCIALLHDRSYHVRRAAIDLLGSLRAKSAIEALQETERTASDDRLAKAAREAINKILNLDS